MRYGWSLFIASVGLPAGVLASIWLIGDLSYDGPVDGGLDYAARPVEVAPATIATAGAVAVLALLGAAVLTGRSRGGRWVLAALTAAGAAIGLLYRVVTAGVIGANIGAGLAFFLILPLVLILLVTAVVLAVRLRPAGTSAHGQRGSPRPAGYAGTG